jgi:transposase
MIAWNIMAILLYLIIALLNVLSFYGDSSLSKEAETVGRMKRTIFNWVRDLGRGVEALKDKHRGGRSRKVSREFIFEKLKLNPNSGI